MVTLVLLVLLPNTERALTEVHQGCQAALAFPLLQAFLSSQDM